MKNNTNKENKSVPHIPVLLREAVDILEVKKGEKYIDATLGFGGHAKEILKRNGVLLGIDRDSENFELLRADFAQFDSDSWKIVQGNFADIEDIAKNEGFVDVSGVIFDLGISSWQLDKSRRGFGYRTSIDNDEKLDMRMDKSQDITATYVVNKYSLKELYEVLSKYGELRDAKRIASLIMRERPISTVCELTSAISSIDGSGSLLARLFQALRIEVNQELSAIRSGLDGARNVLKVQGRLLVISFHSLEDRLVKQTFNKWATLSESENITKQLVTAGKLELKSNSRAKSAKLRAIKKI